MFIVVKISEHDWDAWSNAYFDQLEMFDLLSKWHNIISISKAMRVYSCSGWSVS